MLGSRAAQDVTTWEPLSAPTAVAAGAGFTRLVLVDAGRGRVVPLLQELASAEGCAATRPSRRAREPGPRRGVRPPTAPVDELALRLFLAPDEEGLVIVPYGSMNLEVTALAAMTGDPRLNAESLRSPLLGVAHGADARRVRRPLALAGLAGLGDPVLQDVWAAAAQQDLTVEERVNVALAAFFAGDEDLARSVEHRLLREHGMHLGPWTRLEAGKPEASVVLTARLAIVAASLGEPVAEMGRAGWRRTRRHGPPWCSSERSRPAAGRHASSGRRRRWP